MADKKIIIALDGMSLHESLKLADALKGKVWGFKGHDLFMREGFTCISKLKEYGNIFVDLKLHDIPATVEKEVIALVAHKADLITVHASGGIAMLEAAVRAGGNKVVAVTALTSLSPKDTQEIYKASPEETVRQLAESATQAGVSNIVCSPLEIKTVKEVDNNLTVIVPGIRQEKQHDDQKRTLTAKEAIHAGADLLVIGRPITKAPQPIEALDYILSTLN